MADFLTGVAHFLVRLLLLAVGLVFALSLLGLLLLLACFWAIRAAWARLLGRPVTPWVMRVDPRAGWSRFYQAGSSWPQREPSALERLQPTDITDVQAKEPPPP